MRLHLAPYARCARMPHATLLLLRCCSLTSPASLQLYHIAASLRRERLCRSVQSNLYPYPAAVADVYRPNRPLVHNTLSAQQACAVMRLFCASCTPCAHSCHIPARCAANSCSCAVLCARTTLQRVFHPAIRAARGAHTVPAASRDIFAGPAPMPIALVALPHTYAAADACTLLPLTGRCRCSSGQERTHLYSLHPDRTRIPVSFTQ